MWAWLKHAFAVESHRRLEVTPRQAELVDRLCAEVVRRRMVSVALLALETSRPLNFVAAQAIYFFEPIARALFDTRDVRELTQFLEQRGSVDYLMERLEQCEAESVTPKTPGPSVPFSPREDDSNSRS